MPRWNRPLRRPRRTTGFEEEEEEEDLVHEEDGVEVDGEVVSLWRAVSTASSHNGGTCGTGVAPRCVPSMSFPSRTRRESEFPLAMQVV